MCAAQLWLSLVRLRSYCTWLVSTSWRPTAWQPPQFLWARCCFPRRHETHRALEAHICTHSPHMCSNRQLAPMHQLTASVPPVTLPAVDPVHYHNQYKRSSSAVLWCVFAVSTVCQVYDSGPVWSSFEEHSMMRSWKLPFSWKREGLSAPGSSLFTTCHGKSIALSYQRNNIHKQPSTNGFCVQCACAFTPLVCTWPGYAGLLILH